MTDMPVDFIESAKKYIRSKLLDIDQSITVLSDKIHQRIGSHKTTISAAQIRLVLWWLLSLSVGALIYSFLFSSGEADLTSATLETTTSSSNYFQAFIVLLIISAIVFPIAFLPSIIAFRKEHPNRWLILAINGFLGPIGGLGWLLALVWAMKAVHKSPLTATGEGTDGGESGLNIFANDEQKISISSRVEGIMRRSVVEELAALQVLLDRGAINSSEFKKLKRELMERSEK